MPSEVEDLLKDIDEFVGLNVMGKDARLLDAQNNLNAVRRDVVALRRMLIQHPRPEAHIQELGTTLGAAIRDKISQVKRLEKYVAELELLPDDDQETQPDELKIQDEKGQVEQGVDDGDLSP